MELPLTSFSQCGRDSSRTLASIACLLNLKDTRLSTLQIGIGELYSTALELEESLNDERENLELRGKEVRESLASLASIKVVHSQCIATKEKQEATLSAISQTISYLDNKKREYEIAIQSLKVEIEKSGYSTRISHQTLLTLHEQLVDIQNDIAPKERQLKSYLDMPPDISRARLKVEETRMKLAEMEREMQRKLEQLNL
jgi:chromosome segregation ATPase